MTFLRTTVLIAVLSVLSKLLGAVRQAVFAHQFGAGQEMDIYVAAFRIPDLLFNLLILGTLSVAFIPVFVEYLRRDEQEAEKIASTIFNLALLMMGGFVLLGIFLSPLLVKLVVPGFSIAAQEKTAILTRILLLSPLFFTLSSIVTSILHSHKRFFLAAVAPLVYNLAIIFGVVFLYPRLGLAGLAWGVVFGAFLHFLLQFSQAFRFGLRPFKYFALSHPGVKKIGKLFLPRIIGMDLGQISLLVAAIISSFQKPGSLSVFYFAYDLETVPLGIFAVSFAIAAFPTMSEYFSKKDIAGFKSFFSVTFVQILFLIIPISVWTLLLRAQIVRLILGAGQGTHFSFEDTRLTAQALGYFVLSLFAQSLIPLLARSFYAFQNTVIPVIVGLVSAAVNIVLAVMLTRFAGPVIMALAFSIASLLNMLLLLWALHGRLGDLNDEFLIVRTAKISIASMLMGIATYATLYAVAPLVNMQTYLGILVQTVSALIVATLVYLASGLFIRLPESRGVILVLKSWFSKFSRPVVSVFVNTFTDLK